MNQQRLDEIRQRAEKATPPPWHHEEGILKHYVYSDNGDLGFSLQELHPNDGREWATAETAEFIAHARQDIPDLLAYVDRLRIEVERLKEEVDIARAEALDACDRRNLAYDEVERLQAALLIAISALETWHNSLGEFVCSGGCKTCQEIIPDLTALVAKGKPESAPRFYRIIENSNGQTIGLADHEEDDPGGIVTYQEITEAEYLEYKALWEEEENN